MTILNEAPPEDERTARLSFSEALTAIEAAFKASKDPEQTRKALKTFVNMTADEARS